MNENHNDDRSDRAVTDRLARLRSMPVDTTSLAGRIRAQVPAPQTGRRESYLLWIFGRPLRAAGVLLIGVLLVAILSSLGGPAAASTDRLAEVHQQVTGGHSGMVMKVSSMDGATAAISQQWKDAPNLPAVADEHVMACCVHEMGRKKMACVALTIDGAPVTMAVADSSDVKSPEGKVLLRNGVEYRVESSENLNMAMTERSGRWICLMGHVSIDRLIDTIEQMKF